MFELVISIGYFLVGITTLVVVYELIVRKRTLRSTFGPKPESTSLFKDFSYLPFFFIFNLSIILIICWLISQFDSDLSNRLLNPPLEESDVLSGLRETAFDVLLLTFLLAVICIPLIEEVVFRGVLLPSLLRWGNLIALIVSASLFGLLHEELLNILFAGMGGLVYGILALKYKGVLVPWLYHIADNTIAFFATIYFDSELKTSDLEQLLPYCIIGVLVATPFIYKFMKDNMYVLTCTPNPAI